MTNGHNIGRTGGYYHLLKAVIYRDIIVLFRYPVNAVLNIIVAAFVFSLIFYGGSQIAGQAISDSLEGILVGYYLLALTNNAYSGVSGAVGAEATWGTLERHFLTPFGFGPVMLAKAVAIVIKTFVQYTIMLIALVLLTGANLEMPLVTVFVVTTLAIVSVLGVGMATGGLGVLYKQIGAVNRLISFVFIGLIAAPAFSLGWAKILPLAQGSALLQRAMTNGVRLWEFEPVELFILIGVAVIYLIIGFIVFNIATNRARRLGTLGDY